MKGIDLSNYALEDLLAFDDIFLDFFNKFLKNPSFPQQIQYNRYLGIFEELESPDAIVKTDRLPKRISFASLFAHKQSNASSHHHHHHHDHSTSLIDVEQNKIFDWVRQERLLLFFRTDLFRVFKLCKLLTRPLEEERDDSIVSSQLIGGYSRQSPPMSNSLSEEEYVSEVYKSEWNKQKSFASNDFNEDELDSANNVDLPYLEQFNRILFQRPGSRALSVPAYFPLASLNRYNSSNLLNKSGNFANLNNQEVGKRIPTSRSIKSTDANDKDVLLSTNLKRAENNEDLSIDKQPFSNLNLARKNSDAKKTIAFSLKDDLNKSFYVQTNNNNSNEFDEEGAKVIFNEIKAYFERDFSMQTKSEENQYADDEFISEDRLNSNKKASINENNQQAMFGMKLMADEEQMSDSVSYGYIENNEIHASINQYKAKFLGSVNGMNEFKEFLKDTNGYQLLKFWFDCEFYRDSMQDYDQIENMATRNRLFRDINEKYVFSFAKKVHEKISDNYLNNQSLSHDLFEQIQYDILRRLRAYWVPRFILNKLKKRGKDLGKFPLPPITPDYSRQSTYVSVSSATSRSIHSKQNLTQNNQIDEEKKAILFAKVKQALYNDKESGGPFLRYISVNNPEILPLILFWYDVCDFHEIDSLGYDKNSRLQHAWAIYNSYLSPTARFNIGLQIEVSEEARKSLQTQTSAVLNSLSDVNIDIFQPIMEQIVPYLQADWVKFLKDDVMKYTVSKLNSVNLRLNDEDSGDEEQKREFLEKMPEPDVDIENNEVYVKRTWVHQYLSNKYQLQDTKVKKKVELTEEERAKRLERLRQMEIERKKALKAAARRAKLKLLSSLEEEKKNDKAKETEKDKKGSFQTEKGALFDKMIAHNKSMMQLFRKYLVDIGQRSYLNKFNAFVESKMYLDTNDQNRKKNYFNNLMRNYVEQGSKKSIHPLSERLQKLKSELNAEPRSGEPPRARTPFLIGLQKEYRSHLEDYFEKFCELHAAEHVMTMEEFASLTQTELLVLLGDSYNPKDFDFEEDKGEGKIIPSKEDRSEFGRLLEEWSIGKSTEKMYGFFAHLTEHGPRDGFTFLEKDLLFCIDSIRLREINGEEILKQKGDIVIEMYLDSSIAPAIQIDVNHETQQKLLKSATRIAQGSHTSNDFVVFDETRAQLSKELAPYWAGYKFSNKDKLTNVPMTKLEKQLKERLDEFLHLKNPSPSDFKLPSLSSRSQSTLSNYNGSHKPQTQQQDKQQTTTLPQQTPGSINIVFSISAGLKYKDERNAANTNSTNNISSLYEPKRRISKVS